MSAVPYIGSKISLISKSDIRYEGILNEVDTQASTVALENVRVCGTEDRKKNQQEFVPPSDQIYEFIVFRGSDIKDLTVKEAPPKKPQPVVSNATDPAIVSSKKPVNPVANTSPQSNVISRPTRSTQPTHPAVPAQPVAPSSTTIQKPTSAWSTSFATSNAATKFNELDTGMSSMSISKPSAGSAMMNGHHTTSAITKDPISEKKPAREFTVQSVPDSTYTGPKDTQTTFSSRSQSTGRGAYPRQSRGGRGNFRNINVPASDFDIQSSNAKFDKEEIVAENPELVSEIDSTVYYNRSTSFFDNISCESKGESNTSASGPSGRNRENYKLNIETFGKATAGRPYGRRGGRGSRYHGPSNSHGQSRYQRHSQSQSVPQS
jgi:protein LSM14